MNAPNETRTLLADPAEEGRFAVLQRFQPEDIQSLGRDDLLAAQMLAGHGSEWGRWQTPGSFARLQKCQRDIDLAGRLRHWVAKEGVVTAVDVLIDEGVLVLTRLALLFRVGGETVRYKPSTLTNRLYLLLPKIAARAIRRRAKNPHANGLFGCLTEADLRELGSSEQGIALLNKIDLLVGRNLWTDAPHLPKVEGTTDPTQAKAERPPKPKPEPFSPLPDDWLARIGPRVLWVVQDLGPNLLHLLDALPAQMKDLNWSLTTKTIGGAIQPLIAAHLAAHPWRDRAGRPLTPDFPLRTCPGRNGGAADEWPPRTWEQVCMLSSLLQSAHLFLTLLACAARIGEVATLTRGCVDIARDGRDYVSGYTYKLSGNLFGDERQWPAPDILCQVLGQQARLAFAWDWLPKALEDGGLPGSPRFGDALWVSIGASGMTGEGAEVNFNQALRSLAERLGMNSRPGGKQVHAHRFRKTIGRLAGVALFNSPLVLKRLFGHKSIEMTLHYILCDDDVRTEAESVLRELRIMHCAEALEEIRTAIANGTPLPGNGGAGVARLASAVRNEEERLQQNGRVWKDGSAYDLACLLTMKGQAWRLIMRGIFCAKAPGEPGLCQHKRAMGEPNTANCQPECENRVVLWLNRRDSEEIIEGYLDIARQARDDGQLLVLSATLDNAQQEWEKFPDLAAKYMAEGEVQSLLALVAESEEEEVAA
jgi:hypothetical protein